MALGSGRLWTEEEDRIMLARRKAGEPWHQIAPALMRSPKACRVRYADLSNIIDVTNTGEAAIRRASARLGKAMLHLQIKYADRHHLPLAEAQLRLMGGSFHVSLCAPLKTASAARLAA